MADTSQRKPIYQNKGNNTQVDRNRYSTPKPKGNEVAGNVYNVIRSEGVLFVNAENFSQTDALFTTTAQDIYKESELTLQALETKKARLSYATTFNANVYTLTAKTSTVSEIIDGTFNNQEFQDKTVRNSVVALFDGFHTSFVAPISNTASASVSIQLYDGTFTTKVLKKYSSGTLVNLVANDIVANSKYDVVVIGGEAVLFGIKEVSALVPKPIILSYVNTTTLNYTSGTFDADDYSARYSVTAGTINLATNGLNGLDTGSVPADGWLYTYAIYNPTTQISGLIASLSATTPTLPSGFTKKQRIRNGFIRIVTSAIFGFEHSVNGWIPTGRMQVVSQTNVVNFQQLFCPTVKITVSINAYFSLTQNGQSTMAVWGNIKPFTGSAPDTVFNAQNNASTDGNNGEIEMSDGIVRATHPVISGGINNATITILKINELN